jgi:hypothetical protein
MEQDRMNARYDPYAYLSNPGDIGLALVIVVLLWSRHLISSLRWMVHPTAPYAGTHVHLLDGSLAPAPAPSLDNPVRIETDGTGSPPQGQSCRSGALHTW